MRLPSILRMVVADDHLHARMLNTLSRMEYVGARKILKSRRSEDLDGSGLQHLLEETAHALRLKRAAEKLAGDPNRVATYAEKYCLAGAAGEAYIQGVDAAAEAALADLPEGPVRTEHNYLLSSLAIEMRAETFYPSYELALREARCPFSVASILKDEERHLAQMRSTLDRVLPDTGRRLDEVMEAEERLFEEWMERIETALGSSLAPC